MGAREACAGVQCPDLQHFEDGCVGAGPADAQALELLDQGSFREPAGRLREVLLRGDADQRHGFALFQRQQGRLARRRVLIRLLVLFSTLLGRGACLARRVTEVNPWALISDKKLPLHSHGKQYAATVLQGEQ